MSRRTLTLAIAALMVVAVALPAQATFEGSNGLIAFSRFTNGQNDIWTYDPATGDTSPVTRSKLFSEGMPDWNAAGTQIAYSRCGVAEFSNCDIWIMNADGSGKQRLTRSRYAQETWPTWSPDGTQIAFVSNLRDVFQDVWVMNADGSNKRRITKFIGFDAFPEWSPDGAKIVYTSNRRASNDIWVMNPDGSSKQRLTRGPKIDERPDWSPDGSLIVFTRNGKVMTMGADGSNLTRLTATKRWAYHAPTFSPNGKRIAVNFAGKDGRIGVWAMAADGSRRTQLTTGEVDFFPDWQPK
jgi:TolB protein